MENTHNEEIEIDLREIFYALKKKILIILATGLLFGCFACVYTKVFVNPIYTSSSTMLVLTKETTLASVADLQLGTQLTKDYTVLINSRPVLQEVIDNLGLNMDYKELKSTLTITNPEDTRILEISVQNSDPETAKAIVDELASISSAYIGDKMEVVPPKIIEEGEVPTVRTSPNMTKTVILGVALGLVLSMGVIVLLEVLNDTIKTEDDIVKYLNLSTLASVPDRKDFINKKAKKKSKNQRRMEGK